MGGNLNLVFLNTKIKAVFFFCFFPPLFRLSTSFYSPLKSLWTHSAPIKSVVICRAKVTSGRCGVNRFVSQPIRCHGDEWNSELILLD